MTARHRAAALAPWRSWSGLGLGAAGTFAVATAATVLVGTAIGPEAARPVAEPSAPAAALPLPDAPIVAPEPTTAVVADAGVRSPDPAPDDTADAPARTSSPTTAAARPSTSAANGRGRKSGGDLIGAARKAAADITRPGNGKGHGRDD